MKISTALRISSIVAVVLSLVTLGLVYMMNRSIQEERRSTQRQLEFRDLGHQLGQASDLLTREARRYTILGDKRHFHAYWREVQETKTRDRVVERLAELNAPRDEMDLIEEAKRNSDALVSTEKKAMDAVMSGEMVLARTLMFDDNYDRDKRIIMKPIEEFQQIMNARVQREVRLARNQASLFLVLASGAIITYVLVVISSLYFLFQRKFVTPMIAITNSMVRISAGELDTEIPNRGFNNEIGSLADSAERFKASLAENISLATTLQGHKDNLELEVENRTVQLRQSEARMSLTFESSPSGMVVVDRGGFIIMANSQIENIFGFKKEEMMGQPIEMLLPTAIHTKHIMYRTEFMKTPKSRSMADGADLFGKHKDGRLIPVDIGLNPVEFDTETCIMAAVVDITERKKAQDMMNTANQTLLRSNQELEQVAFVASHDLQEPLRKMSSYAHLLLEEYGDDLAEDGRDYLGIVIDGASRLKALVTDLLAFSRISSHGKELKPTDANECLAVAISNLEILLKESDTRISFDPLHWVVADASQLTMLFQNLIVNAIKYCERSPLIHIGGRTVEDEYEFFVRDNGIGIEPQYFERIFEIFKRLHSRKEYSGTGIGLANCKRITERFGGKIWVGSTPGEGSVFYFTIVKSNL